jgi:hypothetical protein
MRARGVRIYRFEDGSEPGRGPLSRGRSNARAPNASAKREVPIAMRVSEDRYAHLRCINLARRLIRRDARNSLWICAWTAASRRPRTLREVLA